MINNNRQRNNQHGFSLVGIIIACAIVAVFAFAAFYFYTGSTENTAVNAASYTGAATAGVVEHAAAAAAVFLTNAINLGASVPTASMENPLTEGDRWEIASPSGATAAFVCPKKMNIIIDEFNRQVQATCGTIESSWHDYGN